MAAVLDWRLPEPAATDPEPLPWLPGSGGPQTACTPTTHDPPDQDSCRQLRPSGNTTSTEVSPAAATTTALNINTAPTCRQRVGSSKPRSHPATRLFRPTRLSGVRPAALHPRPHQARPRRRRRERCRGPPVRYRADTTSPRPSATLHRHTRGLLLLRLGGLWRPQPPAGVAWADGDHPRLAVFPLPRITGRPRQLGDPRRGGVGDFPPAFAWPADHRWCFASNVDPHWAGIGSEQAAIDTLLNTPELDVVPAQPTEPQPTYY